MTVDVETLHAVPLQLKGPLEMPLGTDWGDERNISIVEGPARVRWNGEVGYGWIERSNRVSRLRRPDG